MVFAIQRHSKKTLFRCPINLHRHAELLQQNICANCEIVWRDKLTWTFHQRPGSKRQIRGVLDPS